jgi:hypothetical protein
MTAKAKYVIVNDNAIVFSPLISHIDMVKPHEKVQSAGFVDFRAKQDEYGETIVEAKCFGNSFSHELLHVPNRTQCL